MFHLQAIAAAFNMMTAISHTQHPVPQELRELMIFLCLLPSQSLCIWYQYVIFLTLNKLTFPFFFAWEPLLQRDWSISSLITVHTSIYPLNRRLGGFERIFKIILQNHNTKTLELFITSNNVNIHTSYHIHTFKFCYMLYLYTYKLNKHLL